MSDKRRTVACWKRPAGPANVWRVVEGREPATGRPARFSIQELPADRHTEAIDHMSKYFVADEVTCKSLELKDDQDAIDGFRSLWDYLLKIGISVAAYLLDANGQPCELVGLNVLFVATDELDKALGNFTVNFKSTKARKLFEFMHEISSKADVRDIYGVDKYISALGLSVAPRFRGQKLGVRLLEARNEIGLKYDIAATSTIFTAPSSQIQAERAGFETLFAQKFSEVRDDDGGPLFPNIESIDAKIMVKRLR